MMQGLSGSTVGVDGGGVFTAIATPAALLAVNPMLILFIVQRLRAILARIRENEEDLRRGDPRTSDHRTREGVRAELALHGRRRREGDRPSDGARRGDVHRGTAGVRPDELGDRLRV